MRGTQAYQADGGDKKEHQTVKQEDKGTDAYKYMIQSRNEEKLSLAESEGQRMAGGGGEWGVGVGAGRPKIIAIPNKIHIELTMCLTLS